MKKQCIKRIALVVLTVCLLLGVSGCPNAIVYFPDKALEGAVRQALGQPFGVITRGDLLDVRELQAAGLNIRSLEGLQYCLNLTDLNLRSNRVQSITELTNLTNLRWLDLGDNIIKDIQPISGLIHLEYLNLFGKDQEIWVWDALVANATANGGALGDGGTVVLPAGTTLNADKTPLDTFADDFSELMTVNIEIIFAEDSGSEVVL